MTKPSILRASILAIAFTALVGSEAKAAPPSPPPPSRPPTPSTDEAKAELLFREGEKAFDAGKHVDACSAFEASLRLGPKLGTLLNVALCHESIGKLATAWREFQHASAWAAQNGQRDRHEFARQHLQGLELRLPRVLLQLPVDRAFAELEIDGEPMPEQRWNLPVYLDPGEHTAAVSAPGKRRTALTFRVIDAPTEQIVVVPSLPDDVPLSAKSAEAHPPKGGAGRSIGLALLGTGGAAMVAGVATGVLALGTEDDSRARGTLTVSFGCFAAGGVLGAIGTYLLLSNPDGPAKQAKLVPAPVPLHGGAGLVLARTF